MMADDARANTDEVVGRFASLIALEHERTTLRRLAKVFSFYMGDRIEVGDASAYIFHYARSQGYKIPAYPLAGNGEIKEFFADQGVRNIPEWYEKLGVERQQYEHLNQQTIVVVANVRFRRKAFFLDGLLSKHDKGFYPLEESGVPLRLSDEQLAQLLVEIFDFLESPIDGAGVL